MKPFSYMILGGICASIMLANAAQAGRIPNLSMTPTEMRKEGLHRNKATTNNTNGSLNNNPGSNLYPTTPFNNAYPQAQGMTPSTAPYPGAPAMANNYMEGYCDPNFQPILSRNASYARIANCLAQLREQACSLYRTMPQDAKTVVDQSVNCLSQNAGSNAGGLIEAPDGTLQPAPPSQSTDACLEADSARLQMLKRYWNEEQTAYAIVFVPDMAMDNSGRCINGGF